MGTLRDGEWQSALTGAKQTEEQWQNLVDAQNLALGLTAVPPAPRSMVVFPRFFGSPEAFSPAQLDYIRSAALNQVCPAWHHSISTSPR